MLIEEGFSFLPLLGGAFARCRFAQALDAPFRLSPFSPDALLPPPPPAHTHPYSTPSLPILETLETCGVGHAWPRHEGPDLLHRPRRREARESSAQPPQAHPAPDHPEGRAAEDTAPLHAPGPEEEGPSLGKREAWLGAQPWGLDGAHLPSRREKDEMESHLEAPSKVCWEGNKPRLPGMRDFFRSRGRLSFALRKIRRTFLLQFSK
ncbi:uncharacterized protein LOC103277682 [Anolis carolinensis]|uniref:uncharacterized protein LOC103277682 n=1 Tax=Anolis carolinensis TaxID=28377 RepID=UPI002F2B6AA1